ncbi:hypothetical protein B7494_g4051 [Chlorociboria aeruginascens]|nr:hypothetical protein B7494_g4051 [Chlorociboria aeruginascens]
MTEEAPEYHTESTPVSPLPIHLSEPSSIPVLRNQTDPTFNMTSTHIHESLNNDERQLAVATSAQPNIDHPTSTAVIDSPPPDSSFSDAYDDQNDKTEVASQGIEVSDDYAMTFDTDEENHSDSQEETQTNVEPEKASFPASVQATDLPSNVSQPRNDTGLPQTLSDIPSFITQPTILTDSHTPLAKPNDGSMAQAEVEAKPQAQGHEDGANGGIDIQQLLDNITANAENNTAAAAPPSVNSIHNSLPKGLNLPAHASLPPRPQISQAPSNRSSHAYDDLSKYHGPPGYAPHPNAYRTSSLAPNFMAAGAPGTSTDLRAGLPPPPSASFHSPPSTGARISPAPYSQIQRLTNRHRTSNSVDSTSDDVDDADRYWGPAVQKIYDEFLANERMYVNEGAWDRFPNGSRLFIGNLPTEKVTKRDLFHVFHKYGKLAQVSIKQAYGFVQFHESAACYVALEREQNKEVRGRKMHLEISKPQKNTRNAQSVTAAPLRRSRSPDRSRGGVQERAGRGTRGVDHYDSRAGNSQGDYGRQPRGRDDYRPGGPSPPRLSYRGGGDYYDSRERRRSRSRSPYGRRDIGRYRERSISPRAREANEDAELQIPRRASHDIPDVQIILMEDLDRAFVSWIENELRSRGIKVGVMFLSPRLPLQAVIRRQIIEGVQAVSQLDLRSQNDSKISLQIFNRQAGANSVQFDEYNELEPRVAAELVLRAKKTLPTTQVYSQPQYASGQSYQAPAAAPEPNLASLVGQLDNASLAKLLGSLNSAPQQNVPAAAAHSTIDLAGILGGLQHQQPPPQQAYLPPQPEAYSQIASSPAFSQLLTGISPQPQVQAQQSAQQVQNIMAQLARFKQ